MLLPQIEQNQDLSRTVAKLRQTTRSFAQESSKIDELRNAHTAQNQLLQKLQEKVEIPNVL